MSDYCVFLPFFLQRKSRRRFFPTFNSRRKIEIFFCFSFSFPLISTRLLCEAWNRRRDRFFNRLARPSPKIADAFLPTSTIPSLVESRVGFSPSIFYFRTVPRAPLPSYPSTAQNGRRKGSRFFFRAVFFTRTVRKSFVLRSLRLIFFAKSV